MPVRITVRARGLPETIAYLGRVERRLKNRRDVVVKVANRVAAVWERNFRSQGSMVGGWPALAEATIRNRERQGMPSGPILIKYGALKAVAIEGFMDAHGQSSWSKSDPYGGPATSARLSVKNGVATLSASGGKIANQYGPRNRSGRTPARPFWFVNPTVTQAAAHEVRDWVIDQIKRSV